MFRALILFRMHPRCALRQTFALRNGHTDTILSAERLVREFAADIVKKASCFWDVIEILVSNLITSAALGKPLAHSCIALYQLFHLSIDHTDPGRNAERSVPDYAAVYSSNVTHFRDMNERVISSLISVWDTDTISSSSTHCFLSWICPLKRSYELCAERRMASTRIRPQICLKDRIILWCE